MIVVGLWVLPSRHEVIMELVIHLGLEERIAFNIVDPHKGLAEGVCIIALSCLQVPRGVCWAQDLKVRGVHSAGNTNGSSVVWANVHSIDTVVVHEQAPEHISKCLQLRNGDENPDYLRVSQLLVVAVARLGSACASSSSVASERSVLSSGPSKNLLFCLDELVLYMPEAARAKVDLDAWVFWLRPNGESTQGRKKGSEGDQDSWHPC
mmetsp:Transcript_59644/g.141931  ORF Transcript_59644/g.141931 Transcript_59644/m.141931 type:complete len:208 (-) Transcript_59644:79-702(-)